MSKKAIIIGSGIAGIASAIRLINKGYQVEVFEKNAYPGGKLSQIQLGEYRFDAGPSLFTMPQFVEELYTLSGKNTSDYFSYEKSEVACKYFFEDGTKLTFYADEDQLLSEIENNLNVDPEPCKKHLQKSAYIYRKTHKSFLEKSLHKFSSYFSRDIIETIAAIPNLGLFTTMHKVNRKALNHPKLVQIFDRFATYNGSNPYQAPGILHVIPHLEHGYGTFFPKGGMVSITNSLVKLAKDLGVEFRFNAPVKSISIEENQCKGVFSNSDFYSSDLVICNSDVKLAYNSLIKEEKAPPKVMQQEPSSSAMIFYWGVKKKFPQLDLHNIFFSADYKKEFDCIFKEKTVDSDPTVYIHMASKMNNDDAPKESETWFVMINVPANEGQDWEKLRIEIRKNVVLKLNRILDDDIEKYIEEEDYLDPIRIEERTSSFAGALYGSSSNDRMAAFFRHPNFSNVQGLYFVGGSVHPGGGIPLCLLSAKIAASLVD
ncbi:MAG: phytoene desaturase [Lentimonas sp.]|jgi:phytoene desaturase